MTSYPPNPDPDRITTEQLVAEAARVAGYEPSWRQLRYWVHNSLLAEPQQKALGRGKGSVALWNPESLPRLILILRARTGAKGRNVELQSARLLLTLKGYAPTDTRALRGVFEELVSAYDVLTVKEQQEAQQAVSELRDMIEHPPDRASRRIAQRLNAMPDRGRILSHMMIPLSLPDKDAADPWQRLGWYGSPQGLRAALGAVDDEGLHGAYVKAGALLDAGLMKTPPLPKLPLPVSMPALPPHLLACVPVGVELSDADMHRLPTTLALLQTSLYGREIADTWIAAVNQLAPIAHDLAHYSAQRHNAADADSAKPPPTRESGAAEPEQGPEQEHAHDAPKGEAAAPLG